MNAVLVSGCESDARWDPGLLVLVSQFPNRATTSSTWLYLALRKNLHGCSIHTNQLVKDFIALLMQQFKSRSSDQKLKSEFDIFPSSDQTLTWAEVSRTSYPAVILSSRAHSQDLSSKKLIQLCAVYHEACLDEYLGVNTACQDTKSWENDSRTNSRHSLIFRSYTYLKETRLQTPTGSISQFVL